GDKDSGSSKYMGQADYVDAPVDSEGTQDSEDKYFSGLRAERQKSREAALDIIEETLENKNITDEQRNSAMQQANALALATEQEAGIETILKAKGFVNVVVLIGEKDVNVIVDGNLDEARTARIQDAVMSQTDFTAADIKIIAAENK
ncbi:MAG: SpoIIIAH-like family protein, partial [Acutalibacteraceae bacterium]|nr:SpoIIIAH-like family protein [Acutalibacteraceae bacterium]